MQPPRTATRLPSVRSDVAGPRGAFAHRLLTLGARGLVAVLLAGRVLAAQAPVVRSPIHLSLPGSAPAPTVACGVDGDTIAVLFVADDPASGGRAVQLALSHDAGVGFAPPVVLDDDTSSPFDSVVEGSCVVLGDRIYVAWLDHRIVGSPGIHFAASGDGGASFSPPRRLSDGYPGTSAITAWDLAIAPEVGGDDVHFAFAARAPGGTYDELFSLSSEDGGATFAAPRQVYGSASSGVDVGAVALRVEDETVHVAWDDDSSGAGRLSVWYRRSLDGGMTFSAARRPLYTSDSTGTRSARLLDLEHAGARVGVLFDAHDPGGGNAELRLALSGDAGASFAIDRRVSGPPRMPVLSLAVDHLLVADAVAGTVALLVSRNDGVTYQLAALVPGTEPRLATDGLDRHAVTWLDAGPVPTVRASFSLDAAATFAAPLVLTDGQGSVAAVQGPLRLEPDLGNVVALGGQVPPATGQEALAALGFSIAGGASATFRNAGANPASLTAALPVFGKLWTAQLDVGSTGHALAGLVAAFPPVTLPLPGGQVLLVNVADASGELLQQPLRPGPRPLFVVSVPNDPRLAGLSFSVQGIHLVGQPAFLLSNAFDLVLGAF